MQTLEFRVTVSQGCLDIMSKPVTLTMTDELAEDMKCFHGKDIVKLIAQMILDSITIGDNNNAE